MHCSCPPRWSSASSTQPGMGAHLLNEWMNSPIIDFSSCILLHFSKLFQGNPMLFSPVSKDSYQLLGILGEQTIARPVWPTDGLESWPKISTKSAAPQSKNHRILHPLLKSHNFLMRSWHPRWWGQASREKAERTSLMLLHIKPLI